MGLRLAPLAGSPLRNLGSFTPPLTLTALLRVMFPTNLGNFTVYTASFTVCT
jgi:hypothetical protein